MRGDIIRSVIHRIKAKSYLEIGLGGGPTFRMVQADRKVGVDKNGAAKAGLGLRDCDKFYGGKSDSFFEVNDENFDVIFIDGDHSYGQSYKDATNALWSMTSGGVVIMHDANPSRFHWERQNIGVFNTVNRLRCCPDLNVFTVNHDCGCAIIQPNETFFTVTDSLGMDDYEPITFNEFEKDREKYINLVEYDSDWLEKLYVP